MAVNLNITAFLSYQTADKAVAGGVKDILAKVGVRAFLAHEDISVSQEWAERILLELERSDIFVCVLSESYLASPWCLQESGIAAHRKRMTVIPVTLDGTTPPGFLGKFQARRLDPQAISIRPLLPGLVKHDLQKGIDLIIYLVGDSRSYRDAEANFELVMPYVDAGNLSDLQAKDLIERTITNNQVHHAGLCARDYIPRVLTVYGHLIDDDQRSFLQEICASYAL